MSSRWSVVHGVCCLGCVLAASGCAVLGKREAQPAPTREPSPALLHASIRVQSGQWAGEPQCAADLPGRAAGFVGLVQSSIAGKLRRPSAPDPSDPDRITLTLSGATKCGNCVPQQAACSTQPVSFERVRVVLRSRSGERVDEQSFELEGTVPSQQADQIATRVLASAQLEAFATQAATRRAQAEAARSERDARAHRPASDTAQSTSPLAPDHAADSAPTQ